MITEFKKGEKPKISIVVPIYQVEKYLEKCIDSILNQTFPEWELILVDDGSADGCGDICDRYAKSDLRIRVIHKVNEGLLKARMDGTAAAKAEYVTFVDGDDYILPERLQTLWNAIEEYGVDLVSTSFKRRYEKGRIESVRESDFIGLYTEEMMDKVVGDYIKLISVRGTCFVQSWSKIYKKQLLEKAFEGMDSRIAMGEDVVTVLATLNLAKNMIVLADDVSYVYNIRLGSMCHSYRPDYIEERERLFYGVMTVPLSETLASVRDAYSGEYLFGLMCHCIRYRNDYQSSSLWNTVKMMRKDLEANKLFYDCYLTNKNHPITSKTALFYWFLVRRMDIVCVLLLALKRGSQVIMGSQVIKKV